jgi:hypothetical protein
MRLAAILPRAERAEPTAGWFEFWPSWLFDTPLVAWWIACGLWYGDQSLPTAANPHITVGGLCGESKSAILDQVAAWARPLIAPWVVLAPDGVAAALEAMGQGGLSFPVVAKPDIGCNGTGVRLIGGRTALAEYLEAFPRGARLILQHYVPWQGEAGLFYVRHPDAAQGRITSVTLKSAPFVVGDGASTLGELIAADPRASRIAHLLPQQLDRRRIPAAGEHVALVFVGNHCKGSSFRDGREIVTAALLARLDGIARALPDFQFGRIDLRYRSLAELRRGEGFRILEINGVGSEPTHVWDPSARLLQAWGDELAHIGMAFSIGAAMRARGHKSSGMRAMLRHWREQTRLMRSYPGND